MGTIIPAMIVELAVVEAVDAESLEMVWVMRKP
jgi:hypothetical protein